MPSLAEFSVKNSLLVNVVSVFFIMAGLYALFNLNREVFPNVNYDTVTVTTRYPGATPQEIEKLITIPLEKELKQVGDIREMFSLSAESTSVITLVIEENAPNKMRVVNDIQRAVDQAEDLPEDLEDKPLVDELETRDLPIIQASLTGLKEGELRVAAKALQKRLEEIPDVARVLLKGYREEEIWVELDPQTMAKQHISLAQVIRALSSQNRSIPGGKFLQGDREYILRTVGEFEDMRDVENTVVRASPLGQPLLVKDIAMVKPAFAEPTLLHRAGGQPAISLTVVKKERGDAITLVEEVKSLSRAYVSKHHPQAKVSFMNDMSYFIKRRLSVLINNGVIGLVLVMICMFTFLSFSTAVSACIGIPTALLLAFAGMYSFGMTINLISMFGLIMVLGMLVDEDIVISENVHRYLEAGMSPTQAAVKGATEVGKSVIATVLTTVAAFAPILFMGGIMGKYTRHIPIVVIITLTASLIEAVLILPSHVSDFAFMAARERKRAALRKAHRTYNRILALYRRVLTHALNRRYRYGALMALLFAGSIYIATQHMLVVLFPDDIIEIFFVRAEGKPGDTLAITAERMQALEKLVASLPAHELENFETEIGIVQNDPHDPFLRRGTHLAQLRVFLTPHGTKRKRASLAVVEGLRERLKKDPPAGFSNVWFEMARTGPPVGKPVQVRIQGDAYAPLLTIAEKVKEVLSSIGGVTDIQDDYEPGKSQIRIVVDSAAAAQTGLTVQQIATTVRQAFEGIKSTSIKTSDEETDILVKFPTALRTKAEALQGLLIETPAGQLIPLKHVATLKTTAGIQALKHHDGIRAINVTAGFDKERIGIFDIQRIMKDKLAGVVEPYEGVTVNFSGEYKDTDESMRNLAYAFCVALGLILLILIAVFRSVLQSLLVMLTVPFSIIGVVIAFKLHGLPISFMAILGLIGLTGVVVDNALIMIDFINKAEERGLAPFDAILEGSALRLRAVFLTTLTTVLSIIPSAYGIGGNDPFITPMALAMNYGFVFGCLLTLIYTPVSLMILADVKRLFGQKCLRKAPQATGVGAIAKE